MQSLLSQSESNAFQSFLSSMDYPEDHISSSEWQYYTSGPMHTSDDEDGFLDPNIPHIPEQKAALAKATKDLMSLGPDHWIAHTRQQPQYFDPGGQQLLPIQDGLQAMQSQQQQQHLLAQRHHSIQQQQQQRTHPLHQLQRQQIPASRDAFPSGSAARDMFPFIQAKQQQLQHAQYPSSALHNPQLVVSPPPSQSHPLDSPPGSGTSSPHSQFGFSIPLHLQPSAAAGLSQSRPSSSSQPSMSNGSHSRPSLSLQPPPQSASSIASPSSQRQMNDRNGNVSKRTRSSIPAIGPSSSSASNSNNNNSFNSSTSPSTASSASAASTLTPTSSSHAHASGPSVPGASSSTAAGSAAATGSAIAKQTLLSPSQKKANHIQSEQKRRANIRKGYEALCETVPALREAIREEEELAAERSANGLGATGRKRRKKGSQGKDGDGDKDKIDGRAGPRSENVVLSKTIDHIQALLADQSALLARLERARSVLPMGHPALTPLLPDPPWEREWTGGEGKMEDDGGEEGEEDGSDEEGE